MRKLASLVEIDKILPIEGADKIEVATMVGKGWKVVVAKDEFKPGDLAVYFEIDSYLPADDERYAFLSERCLRKFVSKSGQVIRDGIKIKTIKLRGQVSQGLLIPVEKFIGADKEIQYSEEEATPYNCVTEDGKPKKFTAKVSGVVLDGRGYGSAVIKKVGSVPVVIEAK